MLGRRDLIALSAAQVVTTSLLLGAGRAQTPNGTYPSKPVRVIVPVAAGGPTDIVARALADKLSAMWHQQVIIENKSGAGNNLGSEYVARSDPDGYTMLFDPGSMSAVLPGQDAARDCAQSQRRHQYGAGRSDAQVQATGDRLSRRRLHARGAGSAAQGRHRPLERRHQVARHQARLMGRRRSLTAPEALQLE